MATEPDRPHEAESNFVAELTARAERFRATFDLAPIGMAHVGLDGRWLLVNARMCAMLGYTHDEMLARTFQDITHPDDLAADLALVAQLLSGQIPTYTLQKRYIRKDGGMIWADLTVSLVRAASGAPDYFVSMVEDITERVQAEAALAHSQAQMAGIIDTAMDAIITVDDDQRVVRWNAAAEQLFRCPAEDAIGQPLDRFIPERFRAAHREHVCEFGLTGDTARAMGHQRPLAALRADGTEFPIEASISRLTVDGQTLFTVILRDITRRLAVEQALRESETRFASAFRASPVAMVISALAGGRIVDANDRFLAMFGRERADVLGQPSQDLGMWVDPADRARALGARVRDRAVRDLEVAVRAAGGQSRQVLLSAEPLNLAGAQCILTALYDITERVQAEAALARQAATLREQAHLLDLAFDAILVHDLDTQTVTFWNAGAAAMYGWTEDEVMGQNAHTLLQTHFPLPLPEIRAVLEREGQWRGELVHRAKGGEELIVDSRWVVRHDEADRPRSVLEINRDITERKRLEAQLLQSQKMESVGQLAGGIAHDFNNLLTAISGYAELIADALPASVDLHAEVQEIQKAAARATLLTRQLLTFARRQPMAARVIDLNEQIRDLGGLLRRLIGEHIALVAVAAPDLAPVWGDPGQIEQVIVNLAVNARDAMPDGGTLTIETDNVDLDPRYARGHLDVPAGQYVMLAVNDTGMGMPPEVQSHIFEPFFTTKPPGEGTGLGLSTCYGIVKQHGGTIWIYSEVGVGTVVKIYLQRYEGGGAAAPAKSAGSAALPRGTETVLLVEDEEAVRALAARVLRSCGYRVLEAPDGAAALRVAEIHAPEVIHLLLTDVVMPQLGGPAVAAQIVTWYPHIRVLFMSGYPGHATIQHGYVDASANMIQKPFTPTTLAQAVRAVLERA